MSPPRLVLLVLACTTVGCSGSDDTPAVDAAVPDACVPGAVTVAVTGPTSYACHAPFRATVSVTNGACQALTISKVDVTGVVTAGTCTPPGPGSYPPTVATVGAGKTVTIFDLTGGMFCCIDRACPASFECDETYTYKLTTSMGELTATNAAHLSLGSCDQICP